MPDPPLGDSIIEDAINEAVDRAVGRYEGAVPPEALEEMRRLARLGLRHDPAARRLLREIVETRTQRPQTAGRQASEKTEVRGLSETASGGEPAGAEAEPTSWKAGGKGS
ncbi:MAG: hypothetical protein IT372_29130 [Polyangiaceae bacterium]|nr:hypothetical protein [Polyangiaceae bacterium]